MNDYEILETIKEDKIFKAMSRTASQPVIIKRIESDKLYLYTLLQEAFISGIAEIYNIFEENGILYIAEEYIEGCTLTELINNIGSVPEDIIYNIADSLCRIVTRLHRIGIIHLDITLNNIIYSKSGKIYLTDFDISYVRKRPWFREKHLMGTVGYVPPELVMKEIPDNRADIYQIGKVIEYLCGGKKSRLNRIIKKSTQAERKKRYRNVFNLRCALYKNKHKIDRNAKIITLISVISFTAFVIYCVNSPDLPESSESNSSAAADSADSEDSFRKMDWHISKEIMDALEYYTYPLTAEQVAARPVDDSYILQTTHKIEVYIVNGHLDEAKEYIEATTEGFKNSAVYFLLWSQIYEAEKDYSNAIAMVVYYVNNYGVETDKPEYGCVRRLEYLLPYCTDDNLKKDIYDIIGR